MSKRTFTIENASHIDGCPTKFFSKGKTGRFVSRDPLSASKKAVSSLCRRKRIHGRCTLYITMRDTTQGAGTHNKLYTYKVMRRKLDKEGPFGNKFETVPKSIGHIPVEDCPKSHKSSGRMISSRSKLLKELHKTKKSMKKHQTSKSKSKKKSRSKSRSKSVLSQIFGL